MSGSTAVILFIITIHFLGGAAAVTLIWWALRQDAYDLPTPENQDDDGGSPYQKPPRPRLPKGPSPYCPVSRPAKRKTSPICQTPLPGRQTTKH